MTADQELNQMSDSVESDEKEKSRDASAVSTIREASPANDSPTNEDLANDDPAIDTKERLHGYYAPKSKPEPTIEELKDGINLDSASILDIEKKI